MRNRTIDIEVPAPGPGKEYYLVFKCGLAVPVIMLKSVAKNGRKCPICKVGLSYKLFRCEMCGKWLKKSVNTVRCKHCNACAKIERKLYQRRKTAELKTSAMPHPNSKKIRRNKRSLPPKVRPDCKWYLSKCLPEAVYNPTGRGRVNCRDCTDYEFLPMHAQVTASGDTFNTCQSRQL